MPSHLPDKPSYVPKDQDEEKSCLELYSEYVKKHRSVLEIALLHRMEPGEVRCQIKWAAVRLHSELDDNEVVQQMADTMLIDHISKIDKMIAVAEVEKSHQLLALMKERRLALKDLAEVRGVRDFRKGKGLQGQIQVIIPNLGRGEGTQILASENGGPTEAIVMEK